MLNKSLLLLLSVLLLSFSGCTSFLPYKMDIRQGNYVSPEMRNKIKVGMSRLQITSALGSPLVSDVFHANRWDYIYSYEEKGKVVDQSRLAIYFEGDFVKRIDDSHAEGNTVVNAAGK